MSPARMGCSGDPRAWRRREEVLSTAAAPLRRIGPAVEVSPTRSCLSPAEVQGLAQALLGLRIVWIDRERGAIGICRLLVSPELQQSRPVAQGKSRVTG